MAILTNRLLASLSEETSRQVLRHCTAVPLPTRNPFFEPNERPKYSFFITSGLASVVTPMEDGGTAEIEVMGHEGLVGSFHLLGPAPIPTCSFMQMEGTGLRIETAELRRMFLASNELRDRILELVQYQALCISQMTGCNRLHDVEARLARWLLMAQDRTQSHVLVLTQEFLGQMLGTQRTTVTASAGTLQRSGFIRYRQGEVTVIDREGLVGAACDCFRIMKKVYRNLYSKSRAEEWL